MTTGLSSEVQRFYERGYEDMRLKSDFSLERLRTQELIRRYLRRPELTILDLGGATGIYSLWLHELGHEVHLVDPVPLHIEQAEKNAATANITLGSISLGDASQLDWPADTFDLVLMLGPLYHLTEAGDRRAALSETYRVLKPGGLVIAVGITRYASLFDGFYGGLVSDPAFVSIMEQDLQTGQHRNPTDRLDYFTAAYFHHPDELRSEVEAAEFTVEQMYALDGFASQIPQVSEKLRDQAYRELLMKTLRDLESEPTLLGISAHLMVVGRKLPTAR